MIELLCVFVCFILQCLMGGDHAFSWLVGLINGASLIGWAVRVMDEKKPSNHTTSSRP